MSVAHCSSETATIGAIETLIGSFLPDGGFFNKQAKKHKRTMDKQEKKMNRKNWANKSDKYQEKVRKKYNDSRKEYKTNRNIGKAIEISSGAAAEGASNVIELPEVLVTPNDGPKAE